MGFLEQSEFKELVRSRTDIVALISESRAVTTRKGGREHVALCPFHDDRNPSMTISTERQSYKCWSCQAGGDCFSYIMEIEGIEFRDALEYLATRAGLEMPKRKAFTKGNHGSQGYDQSITRKSLLEALNQARELFHNCLLQDPQAEHARQYLIERGYSKEMWAKFFIGYHPNNWGWIQERLSRNFNLATLEAARLIGKRKEKDGYYDFFVDRLMFPIGNTQGQTVAFGGRILPGSQKQDQAKYWNSPESTIFSKSSVLYGLDTAKKEIRNTKQAIVTEGYTDCISLHQFGIRNVVGTLGTALTEMHVTMLKRFSEKVVIVFDGDAAGQAAAERSLPRFIPQDLDLRILTLPEALDPADYIRKYGEEQFHKMTNSAPDSWTYKLDLLIDRHSLNSDVARERILNEMLDLLSLIPRIVSTPREDLLLGRLARRLQIHEHTMRQHLKAHRKKTTQQQQTTESNRQYPDTGQYPNTEQAFDSSHSGGHVYNSLDAEGQLSASPSPKKPIENLPQAVQQVMQGHLSSEDRFAREAIEVLTVAPIWCQYLLPHFPVDRVVNCALRSLLEVLNLVTDAHQPDLHQSDSASQDETKSLILRNHLEESELIRLAVWFEEEASRKKISTKLVLSKIEEPPLYISNLIEITGNYRERLDHRDYKRELLGQTAGSSETDSSETDSPKIDEATARLLKQATQVNLKRSSKRSSA